ncbi:hypothetical protein [Shinella granuli]|nr:hypothetical protein [Shinella granuli]
MIFTAYQEAVRLSFFKNGVVDPARPLQDIQAILHHPGLDGAFTLGSGMLSAIAASTHYLVIDRSRYPSLFVPNTASEKTRVRANARPGTPWYEVSKVNDRHSGILLLELREA